MQRLTQQLTRRFDQAVPRNAGLVLGIDGVPIFVEQRRTLRLQRRPPSKEASAEVPAAKVPAADVGHGYGVFDALSLTAVRLLCASIVPDTTTAPSGEVNDGLSPLWPLLVPRSTVPMTRNQRASE